VLAARIGTLVLVAEILSLLGGCQNVGPIAIDAGRDRYNSVLQSTAKVQTLANIVRVYKHEPTSFMDVTEVDATTTFTGTVSGAVSGIGAHAGTSGGTLAGQVGSVTPGVTYSEAPLIRYVPLIGQGLVEQLIKPVDVDALESLLNSGWQAAVVLDLAAAYVIPDVRSSPTALNIISLLADEFNIVTLVAAKSELTAQNSAANQSRGSSGQEMNNSNNASRPTANDALTIFRQPKNPITNPYIKNRTRELWQRLLAMYDGTQANTVCAVKREQNAKPPASPTPPCPTPPACPAPATCPTPPACSTPSANANPPARRDCPPSIRSIELRTALVTPAQQNLNSDLKYRVPVLRTYSALGILKNATETPRIAFVPPDQYRKIRDAQWNNDKDAVGFYILPVDKDSLNAIGVVSQQVIQEERLDEKMREWITQTPNVREAANRLDRLLVYDPRPDVSYREFIHANSVLFALRRYVLIVMADVAPADAYVAYPYQGQWYYIAGDDDTSQKNFNLIALFLTVMAVPPTTQPLGTSINVGR
jgi:hypothetical protein